MKKEFYWEIKSRAGIVVFRRWRLCQSKWCNVMLHNIKRADTDAHCHNHPWSFISIVLKGGYDEKTPKGINPRKLFSVAYNKATNYHKIEKLHGDSAWTLVITGPTRKEWGYLVNGEWIDNETYRRRKNDGTLPTN